MIGKLQLLFLAGLLGAGLSCLAADTASLDMGMKPGNGESYGRTAGEDHYSPLTEINDKTIERLKLAWSLNLPLDNSVTAPVEVDGTLYLATGYSILRAVDARTGNVLWTYDPKAPEAAGRKLARVGGSVGFPIRRGSFMSALNAADSLPSMRRPGGWFGRC